MPEIPELFRFSARLRLLGAVPGSGRDYCKILEEVAPRTTWRAQKDAPNSRVLPWVVQWSRSVTRRNLLRIEWTEWSTIAGAAPDFCPRGLQMPVGQVSYNGPRPTGSAKAAPLFSCRHPEEWTPTQIHTRPVCPQTSCPAGAVLTGDPEARRQCPLSGGAGQRSQYFFGASYQLPHDFAGRRDVVDEVNGLAGPHRQK